LRNGELDREIDRLITNIAKGADFDTYNPKVNELAAERKRVKAALVATLRQLVQAVVVHAPPGTDELAIEITASLSELTLPGPLLKRSTGE
jgi:hypothetical protein